MTSSSEQKDQNGKQPADHKARLIAETDLSKNLVVEAAAGTGKTTLLVSRLVNILINGHARIGEILAITFTEKASVELNERLRARLESIIQGKDSDGTYKSLRDDQKANLNSAIEDLESAQISTIHAFCRSILADRPFEAKLDPGMKTLSEAAGNIYFKKHWERWLHKQLSGANKEYAILAGLDRLFELGMQTRKLEEAVVDLQKYRDVLNFFKPGQDENYEPIDHEAKISELVKTILSDSDELAELIGRCENRDDAGYVEISNFLVTSMRLRGIEPRHRDQLCLEMKAPSGKGSQKNWRYKEDCIRQKEICKGLQEHFNYLHLYIKAKHLEMLLEWLTKFIDEFQAQKVKDGVVDFDDLLIGARDLVRDSLGVRAELQNKYRYILVDEFQDTDPLQVELVFYLAQSKPIKVDKWQDAELKQGKLFLVGDPKQSIYRFRRADIAIYEEAKNKVCAEGGEAIIISQNFRTVPKILKLVNDVFSTLIKKGEGSNYQPDYVALDPYVDDEKDSQVYFLLPSADLGDIKAEQQRHHEAIAIASSINAMVTQRSSTAENHAEHSYKDVAILFAAQTDIHILEDALIRFNVPYIYESGKQFFERREITDLRSVVAAIHQPWDELSVFAALRSQFFQVSDEELFLLKLRFGSLDLLKMTFALEEPSLDQSGEIITDKGDVAKSSIKLLQQLHTLSLSQTPQVVLCRLMEKTAILLSKRALGRRESEIANLMKMIDKARLLNNDENFSFKEFAEWLSTQGGSNTKEPVVPAGLSEIDAVRLMTVHSSKGLEFPIVYIANTTSGGSGSGKSDNKLFIDRENERIGFKFYVKQGGKKGGGVDLQTPNFEDMESTEKEIAAAEFVRLFYVACTRAKKRLYFPLVPSATGKGGFQQHIFEHLGINPKELPGGIDIEALKAEVAGYGAALTFKTLEEYDAEGTGAQSAPAPSAKIESIYKAQFEIISERPSKIRDKFESRIKRVTPSSMLAKDASQSSEAGFSRPRHGTADTAAAGISGKELGTLFHQIISEIPMADNTKLDPAILKAEWGLTEYLNERRAQAEGGGSRDPSAEQLKSDPLKDLLSNFLDSQLFEMIRSADRVLLEVPFVSYFGSARATSSTGDSLQISESEGSISLIGNESIVEGKIDMLIIKDNIIDIVDLKTDRITDEADIISKSKYYEGQLGLYSECLRSSLSLVGEKSVIGGLYLYFAYANRLSRVDL